MTFLEKNLEEEFLKAENIKRTLEDYFDGSNEIDYQLLIDTIEGETNFNEAIVACAKQVKEIEAEAKGLKDYANEVKSKADKKSSQAELLRELIKSCMMKAGVNKISGDCSVRIGKKDFDYEITDPILVPSRFFTQKDPEISKSKINEALKNGETVDGVTKREGSSYVVIK